MKNFTSAARLTVFGLFATVLLTGCKMAEAPQFSPPPGAYAEPQRVAMSTRTFGATIVYTTDGSAPSCVNKNGAIYSTPVLVAKDTVLRAMACSLIRAESLITNGSYTVQQTETVAAPAFSPAAGTFVDTQAVTIATDTVDATIHYTDDGTAPTCGTATAYTGAIEVAQSVTLNAIACKKGSYDSAVATAEYVITPPAAAPVFDPAPGAYTSEQQVALTSATPGATFRYTTDGAEPSCTTGQTYGDPITVANSLTLKAVACASGHVDSLVTSGGYDITLPPVESVWHSIDINNLAVNPPILAGGSTTTNENGDAVNISGRGKFESSAQVFRFVHATVTGDFTFTARLDGVDFAGLSSNQARVGLLLAPDLATTGTNFISGGTMVVGDGTMRRTDRIAVGSSATSNINVTGTGARYLKLTRTGNTYQGAISLDGGATYVTGAVRTFAAGLPPSLNVGFAVSSSNNTTISAAATFSDVHIVDPAGTVLIGPNEFTGDIGSGTGGDPGGGGGGTPPPGPSHPDDQSRGATPAEPALIAGSVANYNIEGFAAAMVTGGGDIPDTDARYRRVTTATELVAALRAARASNPDPVRVIEIMNDLNMGWHEVGTDLQADGLLRQNIAPKKHPALIASGVSLLDIMNFNGLTIFSKNGSAIRHAEFNIKAGTNLILRNLRFEELWEWDEATRGAYDSNDWDFVTIGDGAGVTSGIWVDHCTFTKSYDGVLDIKRGASAVTVSWSEVVPAATGPGTFVQRQFDDLEANRAGNVMYNLLRGSFTQQQIVDIAMPQKKGHLVGSNNLEGLTTYTLTLHHNLYKDLQDRMPRLRGGDVHGYNLYIDSSNARIVKDMRDGIVAADATLAAVLSSTYSFGITSQGAISTEGGAVQIEGSVFFGVLNPFRNNQTDVTNPAYTGAIRGFDIQHILLASDTAFMPVSSQQSTFTDRGFLWASWTGDSDAPDSTLGPTQAPQIPFTWRNGTPTYPMTLDPIAALPALLTGSQGAGAGRIGMTTQQWLRVTN
jgi:pectate lyase